MPDFGREFFEQFVEEQKECLDFLKKSDEVKIIRTERPRFVTADEMLLMHEAIGFPKNAAVRVGLLESAADRAANKHYYGGEDSVGRLAAEVCAGLIQNHPFLDGNKRTAFVATCSFLYKNDCELSDYHGLAQLMIDVARHAVSVDEMGEWLEKNVVQMGARKAPAM